MSINTIKQLIIALALVVTPLLAVVAVSSDVALAADVDPNAEVKKGYTAIGGGSGGKFDLGGMINFVINIMLFVIGAASVIMIVVGGIRYTLSNGDSSAITGAKNTILYAVIGLVVALLAYAIVNFVITQFA